MIENTKWYIFSRIDDLLDKADEDSKFSGLYKENLSNIYCRNGHEFVPDHCGIPSHDFFLYCNITKGDV